MVIHVLGLDLILRRHREDDGYSRDDPETGGPLPAGVDGFDPHVHVDDPTVKPSAQWPALNQGRRDWPSYRTEDVQQRRTR